MSSVASTSSSPASLLPSSTVIGVTSKAALPSSERIGGPVSPTPSRRSALIVTRVRAIAARSPAVSPLSRLKTVIASEMSPGREFLELVDGLHRLRLARQVVGGIVLLDVLELARQRADHDQDHEPHAEHGELRAPPTW